MGQSLTEGMSSYTSFEQNKGELVYYLLEALQLSLHSKLLQNTVCFCLGYKIRHLKLDNSGKGATLLLGSANEADSLADYPRLLLYNGTYIGICAEIATDLKVVRNMVDESTATIR